MSRDLTATQKKVIDAFRNTGRIVVIRRRRSTGKVEVSLSGGRAIPLIDAIQRMMEILQD